MKRRLPWRVGALCLSLILCLSLFPASALADTSIQNIPDGMIIDGTVVTGYEGEATEVTVPEGVTEIGEHAFWNTSVVNVTLPSTLQKIGTSAFSGTSSLSSIKIPGSVTEIGKNAFLNSGVKTVTLTGGSLATIGEGAFLQCQSLESIMIPASVTSVGKNAFAKTKSLKTAEILGAAVLDERAFAESGLQSITMNEVTEIGSQCFQMCSGLTTVSMNSMQSIGASAFTATSLTELVLPNTVTSIGSNALPILNKLTISLRTLTSGGVDNNAFVNMFPYNQLCEIVLTDVTQDVTLLENGVSVDGKEYSFAEDFYDRTLMITTVQAPVDCTITNQTGEDVKIVTDGETFVSHTNSSKPVGSLASGDAYLADLTVTSEKLGEVELHPVFGNLTETYTASVNDTVDSVAVCAKPSNTAAAVTVNGQTADAGNSYTVDVVLETGANTISIVVTPVEGESKTYTLTVTRNAPAPEHITIGTAEELMSFAASINDGIYTAEVTPDMVVELTADIDMTGYEWTPIGISDTHFFAGTFDGNGYTISNLTLEMRDSDYIGLFGVSSGAIIKDVCVTGSLSNQVDNENKCVGGIVGLAQDCTISGCTSEFAMAFEGETVVLIAGGIVGEADNSYIQNCTSNTTITGTAYGYWGGIAGAVVGTEMIHCANRGDLTITAMSGYIYAGGIVGTAQEGAVLSHCINEGDITYSLTSGINARIGGICGNLLASEIDCCTNNGTMNAGGAVYAGGIVADAATNKSGSSFVTSCLNTGAVTSTASNGYVAGISARIWNSYEVDAEVKGCISLGTVSGAKAHAIAVNIKDAVFSGNYYDSSITSSGTIPEAVTSGSTGKTAAELHTQDFIDKINAAGGNFRLNAEGKIEVIPLTYTLTVEGSEAENTGAGSYEAGQQVAIDAGAKPGYQFAGWSAPAGSFADASSAQTTFTMPAENVIVTADFKKISSSTGGGTSAYRITVEESAHGTVESDRTSASRGQLVTLTVKPEENYKLSALTVTDSRGETIELNDEGSGMFTFTMPNGKVTVTAVFTETESSDDCSRDETCPLHGFSDLNPQTWYHDGIHYCLQNGLMIGTDDALFRPEGMTTRAQIVTLLWRLEGEPSAETSPFSDVMADSYYEAAVGWAAASDIVKGVSATSFAPNDPITREQFAAILYRYAQYKGYDVSSSKDSDLSGYADASALSEYAVSAMKWACGKGLVNGTDGNRLDPKGTATRAQAAAMIQRFCASESSSSADK